MNIRQLTGSCLCGKVSYSIASELKKFGSMPFYFCHCQQCRKITGSAFAANILLKPVLVNWISGFEWVNRFDYPSEGMFTKVFRVYCSSG